MSRSDNRTDAARLLVRLHRGFQHAADAAAPVLLLAIRVWTAEAFLQLQVGMLMSGQSLSSAFTGGLWKSFESVATSGFGGTVQASCPLLLATGLFSRGAALAMLLQVVLLRHVGGHDLYVFWAALLLTIAALGPGAFSLDRWLAPGIRTSALPGVRAVARLFDIFSEDGAPVFLLSLRIVIVAILLVPRLPVGEMMQAEHVTSMMAMTKMARLPVVIDSLPAPAALLVAALLLFGVAVRPTALMLILIAPFGRDVTLASQSLYWMLLLGLLFVKGGGAVSLDRLVSKAILALAAADASSALPHVVIVGGGFAGVAAARGLKGASCRVTLIDRQNHHLFQPLLYQVATAGLSPGDIATPIRAIFRHQSNVRVVLGDVTGVDTQARSVRLGTRSIPYDTLVLATGATHSYFGRDEWARFSPGLKTIEDATAIRRRLLLAFEAAENADDSDERRAWLTFVIVGGGPTGVELAGAIAELARFGMEGEFHTIDPAEARVILLQSASRLLPTFPESLSIEAADALRRLGVDIRLDQKAQAIVEHGVETGSAFLPTRTVLWAAGVQASPAAAWLGIAGDRAGRVPVGGDLRVTGLHDVFAVGDTSGSQGWNGKAVPGLAPAAKQAGAYAARVIRAELRGRAIPPPFRYRHLGSLATIGRKAAVCDFGHLRFKGALAWWLWGAAHVAFLVDGRSRAGVVLEWLWDYFTLRRGTRLILGASTSPSDTAQT